MYCLVILLVLLSIIVQLLHRVSLCSQSCKFSDCSLIEYWSLVFLFALIIGVDFIFALHNCPLPPSPCVCPPKVCELWTKAQSPQTQEDFQIRMTLYKNCNH